MESHLYAQMNNTKFAHSQWETRRQVTIERAAELYLFLNSGGDPELAGDITTGDLEGLVHPNGAPFHSFLAWNRNVLQVTGWIE